MKKNYVKIANRSLVAAACLASVLFSGCSQSASPANVTPSSPYVMTASIGGTAFSCDSCSYYYYGTTDTSLTINAAAGQSTAANGYPQITILVPFFHGVGTYALSTTTGSYNDFFGQVYMSSSSILSSATGSITVTALSPNLTGTFNFTTTTGTVVSGGKFTAFVQ